MFNISLTLLIALACILQVQSYVTSSLLSKAISNRVSTSALHLSTADFKNGMTFDIGR